MVYQHHQNYRRQLKTKLTRVNKHFNIVKDILFFEGVTFNQKHRFRMHINAMSRGGTGGRGVGGGLLLAITINFYRYLFAEIVIYC